jgi:hypothetical protein
MSVTEKIQCWVSKKNKIVRNFAFTTHFKVIIITSHPFRCFFSSSDSEEKKHSKCLVSSLTELVVAKIGSFPWEWLPLWLHCKIEKQKPSYWVVI